MNLKDKNTRKAIQRHVSRLAIYTLLIGLCTTFFTPAVAFFFLSSVLSSISIALTTWEFSLLLARDRDKPKDALLDDLLVSRPGGVVRVAELPEESVARTLH